MGQKYKTALYINEKIGRSSTVVSYVGMQSRYLDGDSPDDDEDIRQRLWKS